MYTYRDCYLDQQIAFGVARTIHSRRFAANSFGKRFWDALVQVMFAFLLLSATFAVSLAVLGAVGMEHLTRFRGADRLLYDLSVLAQWLL